MKKTYLLLLVFTVFCFTINAQTIWKLDPVHSSIQFEVSHLVVSTVTGKFTGFSGGLVTQGDSFEGAKVNLVVEVNSINTEDLTRDKHLKQDDFFNAEKFPNISFESTSFIQADDKSFKLVGKLTLRNITKEVSMIVTNKGTLDTGDKIVSGFKTSFMINRFDYNLKWDDTLDTGSLVVGEEVEISMNLELVKQ